MMSAQDGGGGSPKSRRSQGRCVKLNVYKPVAVAKFKQEGSGRGSKIPKICRTSFENGPKCISNPLSPKLKQMVNELQVKLKGRNHYRLYLRTRHNHNQKGRKRVRSRSVNNGHPCSLPSIACPSLIIPFLLALPPSSLLTASYSILRRRRGRRLQPNYCGCLNLHDALRRAVAVSHSTRLSVRTDGRDAMVDEVE